MKKALLLLLTFLFTLFSLFPDSQKRKTVLFMSFDPENNLSAMEKSLLEQTLLSELGEQSGTDILPSSGFASVKEKMDEYTLFAGGDSWLNIMIGGSKDEIIVSWTIKDIQDGLILNESSFNQSLDSTYLGIYGAFWNPLMDDIELFLKPIEITGEIWIKGIPGSLVVGLWDFPLELNSSGFLSTVIPAPANYSFSIQKEGFYPEQIRFYLQKDETVQLVTDQKKQNMFSFQAGLYMFSYPSLAASVQIPNTGFYATLGADIFLIGFSPGGSAEHQVVPQIFDSTGLLYPNFSMGWIFETEKRFFRFPLGAGFMLRMTPLEEINGLLDPLSPWALYLSFSTEYRITRNFMVYLEMRPTFYYTEFPDIYEQAYYTSHLNMADTFMADLSLCVLGVRYSP